MGMPPKHTWLGGWMRGVEAVQMKATTPILDPLIEKAKENANPAPPPRPPDMADALSAMGPGLVGKRGRSESFLTGAGGMLANANVKKTGLLTGGYP